MNRLKPSFFFFLSLFFYLTTPNAIGVPATSPAARENNIIDTFLPQHCVFSGVFLQRQQLTGIPAPLLTKGTFYYDCNRGLIWQTTEPSRQTQIFSQQSIQFTIASNGDIEAKNGRVEKNLAKLLNGIMGGDKHYLNRYFKLVEPATNNRILLQPRKKRMQKFIADLQIVKNSDEVSISWQNANQDKTELGISNETPYKEFNLSECKAIISIDQACNKFAEIRSN